MYTVTLRIHCIEMASSLSAARPGMMIRNEEVIEHKRLNLIHTVLLFGGIIVLLGGVAILLFGLTGFFILILSLLLVLFLTPRISPDLVLKMYEGKVLSYGEAAHLYDITDELSRRAGLDASPRLFYLPSNMMNAFAAGSRDNAAIGITDGMLRCLSLRELTGIVAHEISHIRNNDMKVMATADLISRLTHIFSTVGQFLLILNLPLILMGFAHISLYPILLLIAAPALSGLLQLALSRTREFDADLDAARLTGDPRGLAGALKKLEYYRGAFFRQIFLPGYRVPSPSLFRTHPHTQERIRRLMQIEEVSHTLPREITALADELFSFPPHYRKVSRKPRWRIGGRWY